MPHTSYFFSDRIKHVVACFLFVMILFPFFPGQGNANSTIPPEVQRVVTMLLALEDPKAPLPDKAALDTFLSYTTSPINLTGVGEEPPFPANYKKSLGILWRSRLQGVPLATTMEYLFNPKVPLTVVYPASIRYAVWQSGSDILSLSEPLWRQLGKHKNAPLVLRGAELEEVTPDDNSGAYYKYVLDRVLILTEFEGQQVIITLSWQKGRSEVGKKAATIGEYSAWDFVYSGAKGTLASGLGWAETYIYSSASLGVFYEDVPGGNVTGYALYRWLDAGWSGMNMVKRNHLTAGAERSFAGIKSFMESPKRPASEMIRAYIDSLKSQELADLQAKFAPYSAKVEEAAATVSALEQEDFQKIIKDGGYGKSMNKDELIAAFAVNWIKEHLGKPLLAGSLDRK